MPPRRDSSSSVDDLITALKDEKVLEAIGAIFESKLHFMSQQINELKAETEMYKKEITELKVELKTTKEKVVQLEAYSRVDNLVISGLPVVSYQDAAQSGDDNGSGTNPMLEQQVIQLFNGLPLNKPISASDISVTHRLKPIAPNKPAPVIVRFTNRKAKDAVYRARRHLSDRSMNTAIYVNEDLTKSAADLFRHARESRRQRKIFSTWTYNGTVYIKRSADASCRPQKITHPSDLPS